MCMQPSSNIIIHNSCKIDVHTQRGHGLRHALEKWNLLSARRCIPQVPETRSSLFQRELNMCIHIAEVESIQETPR